MDVSRQDFNAKLDFVLSDISISHFVAIDLELSGIAGQQTNKPRRDVQGLIGLPTLQERYTDIKSAAERYQVLQLGITCVLKCPEEGKYVLKPYNFFLNPLPDSRLNLERVVSYHSGAIEFLLNRGFRMDAPYSHGVPYLSRAEEAAARGAEQARYTMSDIELNNTDWESLMFLEGIRNTIDAWRYGRELGSADYLNIPSPETATSYIGTRGLNGFQKRLVHQFVRKTYPDLVTMGRNGFIQVLLHDKAREDANQAQKDRVFELKMEAQIGLRWPVEALAGGALEGLTTNSFLGHKADVAGALSDLKAKLQAKRTILVGHNILTDLVYLYQCFFGQLPDLVEDFQEVMHKLFPVIIDTKYLATRNDVHPVLARSSLEELDDQLSAQKFPIIETHPHHTKYTFHRAAHEAGYDSFMTAKVLIRLSAKLGSNGRYQDKPPTRKPKEAYFTAPEGGGVSIAHQRAHNPSQRMVTSLLEDGRVSTSSDDGSDLSHRDLQTSHGRRQPKEAKKPTKFSHAGRYDVLDGLNEESLESSVSEGSSTNDTDSQVGESLAMPTFDDDFWSWYRNKLTVNGTVEGVCSTDGEPYNPVYLR